MCLDQPEMLVDATRDFREDVGGVFVTAAGCLLDRGAHVLALGGESVRERGHVCVVGAGILGMTTAYMLAQESAGGRQEEPVS
jgi:hypothetical protein